MAKSTDTAGAGDAVDWLRLVRNAGWAALIALGMLGVFVGLLTIQNIENRLVLETRPGLLASWIGIVVAVRVFIDLPNSLRGFVIVIAGGALAVLAALYRLAPPSETNQALFELWAVVGGLLLAIGLGMTVLKKPAAALGSAAATVGQSSLFGLVLLGAVIAYPLAMLQIHGNAGSIKWIDNFGIQILIYVMLGWGLNIVVGLAGLLDLGYVAFYAVGAYSYALLAKEFGLSFWILLPTAGVLAAFWGIILGFPVLRLRGDYLAIVTLAFGEIIRLVLINWVDFSGGYAGISGIPRPTLFGIPFNASDEGFAARFGLEFSPIYRTIFLFYLILALALLTAYVTVRMRRMPVGRAWEALREDEIACRSLGINTTNTKLTAFALGAMFGGFAGAFFSARQGFISPESFVFIESAQILAIVVLGGMGSLYGIVIAAIALVGGFEILRELAFLKLVFGNDFDPSLYRGLIFGAAMVLIMLWKPRGLISTRSPTAFLKERKAVSGDLVKEGHG
ncbi:high-affinity branched-chain amino acid ABC transporter permease LivM [Prosthecomicrobium sp. N25]|uniref:high-affinity branched-chain amino acid ABC transporter permease LivM n=1 Tax=Prosthecomicrobium sp. N25 TaxID=3129254 RepID=UPI0030768B30